MEEPKKTGRPTVYTEAIGDKICEQISEGMAVASICKAKDMPAPRSVYRWLRTIDGFRQNYEQAKEDQADAMVEKMLEIADSAEADNAQVARLQVDTRKWVASKFKAKKYGDAKTITHAGSVSLTDLSDEELERKLAQLEQTAND